MGHIYASIRRKVALVSWLREFELKFET